MAYQSFGSDNTYPDKFALGKTGPAASGRLKHSYITTISRVGTRRRCVVNRNSALSLASPNLATRRLHLLCEHDKWIDIMRNDPWHAQWSQAWQRVLEVELRLDELQEAA
jgi:hypothetical protein